MRARHYYRMAKQEDVHRSKLAEEWEKHGKIVTIMAQQRFSDMIAHSEMQQDLDISRCLEAMEVIRRIDNGIDLVQKRINAALCEDGGAIVNEQGRQ